MNILNNDPKYRLIRSYFKALEINNAEAISNLFSSTAKLTRPDQTYSYPYGVIGRDKIKKYWSKLFSEYNFSEFSIKEIEKVNEDNSFVVQHTGKMKLLNKLGENKILSFSSFVFNDQGKIEKFVEIFYPLVKTEL
ncbi:nuclear transport factor 2 family protein [Neotamlana laminarinivorans]|uniref:Nuclear transport factor 2 family protein n=1 Tax=Neotamlana laminarinivorans TaxID=2883124 RepID=A0A9X1HZW0_9FLAO|nr:nuclear transport factor 2 family protein [Tamlana laminarinivorans]MCB4798636.1 nuclear transport factor 2 family protein [Tamlana laminarinivorans]